MPFSSCKNCGHVDVVTDVEADESTQYVCEICFDLYHENYERSYDEPDWCDGCGRILSAGQKCMATDCPQSMMLGTNWL